MSDSTIHSSTSQSGVDFKDLALRGALIVLALAVIMIPVFDAGVRGEITLMHPRVFGGLALALPFLFAVAGVLSVFKDLATIGKVLDVMALVGALLGAALLAYISTRTGGRVSIDYGIFVYGGLVVVSVGQVFMRLRRD